MENEINRKNKFRIRLKMVVNRYKANTQTDLRFSLILTCGIGFLMSSVLLVGSVLSRSFVGMFFFGIGSLSMLHYIRKLKCWKVKDDIGIGNQKKLNMFGLARQITGR